MRARLEKKRGIGGGAAPPVEGLGGRSPPHLQMVVILVGLIHSNSISRRSDSSSRRRYSD